MTETCLRRVPEEITELVERCTNHFRNSGAYQNQGNSALPYHPIDPNQDQIRLLQLFPAREANGKKVDIECSLFTAPLDDLPDFDALSYCWGDSRQFRRLLMDGYPLYVSKNLHNALKQLRSRTKSRIFWVDALCINQEDTRELNEQILNMRTIYQRASVVRVWLGRSTNSSRHAFKLLHDMKKNGIDSDYVASILEDPGRLVQLEGLCELLNRDYWRRVWVVQEVAAARTISVHCGRDRVKWSRFLSVQDLLWTHHANLVIDISNTQPSLRNLQTCIRDHGPRSMTKTAGQHTSALPDFFETIILHRRKESTNPRDMIYSFVGMTSARHDPRFIQDYSRSIRQVYIDVVEYVLATSQKLDIICGTPRSPDPSKYGLPSWTPDWTYKFNLTSLLHVDTEYAYRAAGTSNAQATVTSDTGVLITGGICIGNIGTFGQQCQMEDVEDLPNAIRAFHNWRQLFISTVTEDMSHQEAFCRTLNCNQFKLEHHNYCSMSEFLRNVLGGLSLVSSQICPDVALDEQLTTLAHSLDKSYLWAMSWVQRIADVIFGRRFFISSSGFIGLGPETAKEGDLICILLGCSLPVILRRQGDHHLFVGEAYADQYMYGEGIEELEKGNFALETFEIH